MGEDNPPSFSEADPCLALPSASELAIDVAFEGYGDAGEVFTEGDDLEPGDGARKVNRGPPFTKSFDLADAVQSLRGAKTRYVG